MARVVVTLKIMPKNVKTQLDTLEKKVGDIIKQYSDQFKVEREAIAFGLTALKIIFVWDEANGGTDFLEDKLKKLKEVASVELIDVRRAIG